MENDKTIALSVNWKKRKVQLMALTAVATWVSVSQLASTHAASWSLSSSINAISTNTSTESNDILTWPTGILIGSLLWLIVVVIVVRKLYEVFKGK